MVNVLKASGSIEPFSKNKLFNSFKRTGIPENQQNKIISNLEPKLYENIPTSEVYRDVTKTLQEESHLLKLRYSLKRAIMELGPTGHPFEDLVAEILKSKGYITEVRSILMGKCVNHEIDVIAEKDGEKLMVEAKFHNAPGIHTDLHVSLYTRARFEDLKEKYNFSKACLFTNTKITPDALAYAQCVSMDVTGWNYPQNEGLRELVEQNRLYPITILSALSQSQKKMLLENHIVLINEVLKNASCLDVLGIQPDKKQMILEEAKQILS
jgi:Holliday junction resolvase-like predicted endonuclease